MAPKHLPVSRIAQGGEISCGEASRHLECYLPHEFDAIITDPPYQLGIAGQGWDKAELDIDLLAYQFHRLVKPTGNVFVFCSDFQFGRWYEALSIYFPRLRKFAWCKTNPMGWIKGKFIEGFELGLHASGKHGYFNPEKSFKNYLVTAATSGNERLKRPEEDRKNRAKGDRSLHPTQKPLELMRHLIEALTKEGDHIFDPFAGTATTAAAARELGREYTAVEYELKYFKAGLGRL